MSKPALLMRKQSNFFIVPRARNRSSQHNKRGHKLTVHALVDLAQAHLQFPTPPSRSPTRCHAATLPPASLIRTGLRQPALRLGRQGHPAEIRPSLDEADIDMDVDDEFTTKHACAQLGVTREAILERPQSDYVRFREWLLETEL
ncbi:Uu.00g107970.m01.CDS01 [Anthostomella pinea]|uniref:Uu.00g107970.m01.CDS01 n=1 Tax=Anthostomella pinea TaxID=933095 RepID=A0AAI8YFY3_9PEZI|nr:Uu.00g107970.m01.CDS01 [Anthostomella pinea]